MIKLPKILTFYFIFIGLTSFSAIINSVKFEGLTKTKESFLFTLIQCKVGQVFDTVIIKEDVQTLRNLNLFFSVESDYNYNDSLHGFDLVFLIKEAKYVYPLLALEGINGEFKAKIGLNNINWWGRNQTIGFLYQYYDRHSLSIYQKTPRHKNGKTGHEMAISKYSTVEPLYFYDTTSNFNFDNYSVDLVGKYWFNTKLNLDLGGMFMYEKYLQLDTLDLNLPSASFSFFKYQIKSSITYNSVNQHYEFFDGLMLKFYIETIQTKDYPMASFLKLKTNVKYYTRLGENGNFGIHHNFGIATNNFSPFSPFVLDGFINIRGIGNRVIRGTAENIINLEYRHTILNKKYFTLQTIAFTDIGSLRQAGDSFKSMFSKNALNYYSGIGLRLHSKFFYKAIFRVDYAVNVTNFNQGGFSFGLGQFF